MIFRVERTPGCAQLWMALKTGPRSGSGTNGLGDCNLVSHQTSLVESGVGRRFNSILVFVSPERMALSSASSSCSDGKEDRSSGVCLGLIDGGVTAVSWRISATAGRERTSATMLAVPLTWRMSEVNCEMKSRYLAWRGEWLDVGLIKAVTIGLWST